MIVVGLNGGCASVIERGIQNGTLESFRRLRKEGAGGRAWSLTTSPPAAWSAHLTGVHPEVGGVDGYLSRRRIQWGIGVARTEDLRVKTYPELLDEAGVSVGLVNLPPTYPPLELDNGFSVSGMFTPVDNADYVHPPSLSDRLTDYRIGVQYDDLTVTPFGDPVYSTPSAGLDVSLEQLKEDVLEVEARRLSAALRLMDHEDPDLLVVMIADLDVLHHFTHHELADGSGTGPALFGLYRTIDDFLGRLMRRNPHEPLLVFSSHGYRGARDGFSGGTIGSILRSVYRSLKPRDFLGGRADLLADLRGTLGPWVPRRLKETGWYARLHGALQRLAADSAVQVPGGEEEPDRPRQTGVRDRRGFWGLWGGPDDVEGTVDLRFLDLTVLVLTLMDQPVPERYGGSLPGNVVGRPAPRRVEDADLSVDRGRIPAPNRALRQKLREELGEP